MREWTDALVKDAAIEAAIFVLAATIIAAVATSHFRADTEKQEGLRIGWDK